MSRDRRRSIPGSEVDWIDSADWIDGRGPAELTELVDLLTAIRRDALALLARCGPPPPRHLALVLRARSRKDGDDDTTTER